MRSDRMLDAMLFSYVSTNFACHHILCALNKAVKCWRARRQVWRNVHRMDGKFTATNMQKITVIHELKVTDEHNLLATCMK